MDQNFQNESSVQGLGAHLDTYLASLEARVAALETPTPPTAPE